MTVRKVLITTPDYPPNRVGGISTFVLNLESILKNLRVEYKVLVWTKPSEMRKIDTSVYDIVFNAHYMAATVLKHKYMINFIHGGELLPYSPGFFKRLVKKAFHKKLMSFIEQSHLNIFISEFTFELFKRYSKVDYSRDIIHHNCIDTSQAKFYEKNLKDELILCCFARDVPHKNLAGVIKIFEFFNRHHPRGAKLYLTSDKGCENPRITSIENISDEERELIYQKSHLNLLLSLDHCEKGQVEGFGLTILEAGKYGTPSIASSNNGLLESVHHKKTGWNLEVESEAEYLELYKYLGCHYSELQRCSFEHTVSDHGLDTYEKLIRSFLE